MRAATHKVLDFMGLDGEPDNGDAVPQWQGRPAGTAWRVVSTWIALAIVAYLLLNARMPDDDGFGGFVPLWFAATIGIAGIYATERAMIRKS